MSETPETTTAANAESTRRTMTFERVRRAVTDVFDHSGHVMSVLLIPVIGVDGGRSVSVTLGLDAELEEVDRSAWVAALVEQLADEKVLGDVLSSRTIFHRTLAEVDGEEVWGFIAHREDLIEASSDTANAVAVALGEAFDQSDDLEAILIQSHGIGTVSIGLVVPQGKEVGDMQRERVNQVIGSIIRDPDQLAYLNKPCSPAAPTQTDDLGRRVGDSLIVYRRTVA